MGLFFTISFKNEVFLVLIFVRFNVIFRKVRWSVVPRYDTSVEWAFLDFGSRV